MQLVATPTDAEIAWAAGFFEGEGYFTSSRHQLKDGLRHYPHVGINNTNLEMLQRFHRIVGVGAITVRSVAYSPFNAKPQWKWMAGKRKEAEHVRDLLLPWLSQARRDRAAEVFDDLGNLNKGRPRRKVLREAA